jgi:hypothetical protein
MKRLVVAAIVLAFAVPVSMARADDKPNPTGTWKWSVDRNGQKIESTLKLKMDKDKLTGALVGRDGKDTDIEDATFKDGEVSFKVTRDVNGTKRTQAFSGKVSGDTIKGKIESERNGQKQSRDWEASRSKD